MPGKDGGLIVLSDKPLVAETPERLLDDDTTPTSSFYICSNGQMPDPVAEPDAWKLTIDGEVNRPLEITLGDLKKRFQPRTYRMVLENGGNGRSYFAPDVPGHQWTNGGVGCAEWTGVPLADVLRLAGIKPSAVYTANTGADVPISGDPSSTPLSRGVPLRKAMDPYNLLVWAMNGKPLESVHGAPLRLLIPGWPGSVSHKWLTRITLRDRVHDGPGMTGTANRVAIKPMLPGGKTDESNFKILESMPVRSIITSPANGTRLGAGTKEIRLRGAAWAGDLEVRRVDVSIDFGATWAMAYLAPPRNRYDWRRWVCVGRLAERRLLRDLGAGHQLRQQVPAAHRRQLEPRKATAPIPCIGSPCWLDERRTGSIAQPCSRCLAIRPASRARIASPTLMAMLTTR